MHRIENSYHFLDFESVFTIKMIRYVCKTVISHLILAFEIENKEIIQVKGCIPTRF